MPKIIEGKINAKGMRFGLVASRFNDFICSRLIDGAVDALSRSGADAKDIEIVKVPGAFEIPLAAKKNISAPRSPRGSPPWGSKQRSRSSSA